jgi:hypothetical protein
MNQQELGGLGFVVRKLELLKQRNLGEKKVEAVVFMPPNICLDSSADFESRKITDSRKFRSKKDYLLQNRGHVLTPFFGKTGQKDKKEQLIRKQRQLAD